MKKFSIVEEYPIDIDLVKDLCQELVDEGYTMSIKKQYCNAQSSGKDDISNSPIYKEYRPILEVKLIGEISTIKEAPYWNGSLYYSPDSDYLFKYYELVERLKKNLSNCDILFHMRGNETTRPDDQQSRFLREFSIRIICPVVKSDNITPEEIRQDIDEHLRHIKYMYSGYECHVCFYSIMKDHIRCGILMSSTDEFSRFKKEVRPKILSGEDQLKPYKDHDRISNRFELDSISNQIVDSLKGMNSIECIKEGIEHIICDNFKVPVKLNLFKTVDYSVTCYMARLTLILMIKPNSNP